MYIKTQFQIKSRNDLTYNIIIATEPIQRVKCTKFLGLYIDDDLGWTEHIDYVCKMISSGCYAINQLKSILKSENLKLIYQSLVHSHLMYGISLWGAAFEYKLKRVKSLQKKCIRNICKAKYNSETSSLFRRLNILKFDDVYRTQLCKMMYKVRHDLLPQTVSDLFTVNSSIHTYNTRHRNDPHVQHRQSNQLARSFLHRGPKYWLELPSIISSSLSIFSFNRRIKKYMTQSY